MRRSITGFHRDDEGHWVAELDCGHGQHVRHVPPFTERPWVTTAAGRASRLGLPLDCLRCDRRELPDGLVPMAPPPAARGGAAPEPGLAPHATGPGVWTRIHVHAGCLRLRLGPPFDTVEDLRPGPPAIVPPGVEVAAVEATDEVRMAVERLALPGREPGEGPSGQERGSA